MTQILVIVDNEFSIETQVLENQLKEEVTRNSVSQDGVSLFECGTPVPQGIEWDWVGLIGTCTADIGYPIDVEIPLEEDPVGNLITALAAVLEDQDNDIAIGE